MSETPDLDAQTGRPASAAAGDGELSEEELLAAKRAAEKFDLRKIIAGLFGIYSLTLILWGVLILVGLVGSGESVPRPVGVNLNLWTGLGMLVVGAALAVWAVSRPIRTVEDEEALEIERLRQEQEAGTEP